MRSKRPSVAWLSGALAAAVVVALPATAQQADPYPSTLHFGTGLINTPVAWVSPNSADAWVQTSAKRISYAEGQNFATKFNTNISIDTHWLDLFSVGASAYSQNPEYGFFGQVLAVKPHQFGFVPAIAAGVRNVGKYKHEDRYLVGEDIKLNGNVYDPTTPPFYQKFKTAPTFYGVATEDFALGGAAGGMASSTLSLNVGYGNGIFSDDGGQGQEYNDKGQIAKGLFLGARYTFHPSLNSTLTILGENDGWDYNAGVVYDYRGITAGLYGTELEEGGKNTSLGYYGSQVYNYTKINFSLGYNGNIVDISRGVLLRARITDLTREQQRLRLEISKREERIRRLETELRKAQAGELADIEQRRRNLERDVEAEREAIRRANERLQQLQSGQQTPPPSTPSSTPPSSSQPAPSTPPSTPPAALAQPAVLQ